MIIKAPFTPEQVRQLDEWQHRADVHPFTCGNRADGKHPPESTYRDHGALRATVRGWICAYCDYTQGWAHDFMAGSFPTPPDDPDIRPDQVIGDVHLPPSVPGEQPPVSVASGIWRAGTADFGRLVGEFRSMVEEGRRAAVLGEDIGVEISSRGILTALRKRYNDADAALWLRTPNVVFNGARPFDVVGAGGDGMERVARVVEMMLAVPAADAQA